MSAVDTDIELDEVPTPERRDDVHSAKRRNTDEEKLTRTYTGENEIFAEDTQILDRFNDILDTIHMYSPCRENL